MILPRILNNVLDKRLDPIRIQLRFVVQQQLEADRFIDSKGRYIKTNKQNKDFETFYKSQKICEDKEWRTFMDSCRKGLPSVFRVLTIKPESKLLLNKIKDGVFKNVGLKKIPWYPDDNTFRFDKTRWELREEKGFHKILDTWRNNGSIYRQEQVSMVPVACLDIEPHHNVLDMCSSPGSKTGQVLEAMHRKSGSKLPTGVVIANEVDLDRCKNLSGNMKLFNSPILAVTAYNGQYFPDLKDSNGELLKYDRIVCDVPCSGDGTIRKNPSVWNKWHPGRGNMRYFLQLKIARRGIELLKEGGLFAYSSCSINQIENECVVAQLLKEFEGGLELVDMRDRFLSPELGGLRFEPGLATWSVFDSEMRQYSSYDQVPDSLKTQIAPEMFNDPENLKLNLDRCMRFLPHHNDDGGFFVAILRKTKDVEGKVHHVMKDSRNKNVADYINIVREVKDLNVNENSDIQELLENYGLDIPADCVFNNSDNQGGGNNLFFMNQKLKQIVEQNREMLEVCHLGAHFAKKENLKAPELKYKLKSDAMWFLKGIMSEKRVVKIETSDLIELLASEGGTVQLKYLSQSFNNQLIDKNYGSVILHVKELDLSFPAFSSRQKIIISAKKEARKSLLDLINL